MKQIIRYTLMQALGLVLCLLVAPSCQNQMRDEMANFPYPETLTMEKVIGVTWKVDRLSTTVLEPKSLTTVPDSLRELVAIKGQLLNSILLSKTGTVYASYIDEGLGNVVFYYEGKWQVSPDSKDELLIKMGTPIGNTLEFRLKVRKLNLLNNILTMEVYGINPKYTFSLKLYGKGNVDENWTKETDIIDQSWTQRNVISKKALQKNDVIGSYRVNQIDWKRVTYIDDASYNYYPLITRYVLSIQDGGEVQLAGLPTDKFGLTNYKGSWHLDGHRVVMDFPVFPFRGDITKYRGISEVDFIILQGPMYARHNVQLAMELVRREEQGMLVRFTEPGMCSVYVYLNNI